MSACLPTQTQTQPTPILPQLIRPEQVANSILWFAFLKALYRATLGRWIAGRITFKVTAKGLQRIADLPIRREQGLSCFGLVSLGSGVQPRLLHPSHLPSPTPNHSSPPAAAHLPAGTCG